MICNVQLSHKLYSLPKRGLPLIAIWKESTKLSKFLWLVGSLSVRSHVLAMGTVSKVYRKSILGCVSNPWGGTLSAPVKKTRTSEIVQSIHWPQSSNKVISQSKKHNSYISTFTHIQKITKKPPGLLFNRFKIVNF